MRKVSSFVFILLKNSFIISVLGLFLALLGGPGSFLELVCGTIGFYVAIIAIDLFFIYVLLIILASIFERDQSR